MRELWRGNVWPLGVCVPLMEVRKIGREGRKGRMHQREKGKIDVLPIRDWYKSLNIVVINTETIKSERGH